MLKTINLTVIFLLFCNISNAQQSVGEYEKRSATSELTPEQKSARLDQILKDWEARMTKTESFGMAVTQTIIEPVRKTSTEMKGTAYFQKPNLAFIDLSEVDANQPIHRRFLIKGKDLYLFDFKTKEVKMLSAPTGKDIITYFPLPLLFGMKAAELKERFTLNYLLEDTHYVYIDIVPKKNSDKQEFKVARLTLVNNQKLYPSSYIFLRQIEYINSANESIKYVFTDYMTNNPDSETIFKLVVPVGWKLIGDKTLDGEFSGNSKSTNPTSPGGLKQ
ncbi:TIGR03009 domain-containing protein [Telmatocola sphagniphila]|uniref:TIGR03009 domain-containing protein n=1 Tax=Telmatocola sphagniphila TaxID=1123043 RepID=A0A8E6B6G5_9BACT|nr:TIGR03009 domain-containing protein [Telmatocola sphagniphila]QVL32772.1 TIGR03009 domain-containing protein [Telmatocola sphagniphila]